MVFIDMEMPKKCLECPCFKADGASFECRVPDKGEAHFIGEWEVNSIPDWCPMKDLDQ